MHVIASIGLLILSQAVEPGPPPIAAFRNLPSGPVITPSSPHLVERARPRADLASLVSDHDYPASALRNREEGTVAFWLQVTTEGRVSNCLTVSSSGSAALDAGICRLMRSRARFTPARDAAGAAASDTFNARYTWRLPPPRALESAPAQP